MPSGVYIRTKTYKHTEESKLKISLANKGHKRGLGKKLSNETKQKISDSLKGRFKGVDNPNYGNHCTEEVKKIISLANKGKKLSETHKEILRNVNWKGGKYIIDGYMRVYVDNGIYIFEHRLIMETLISRKLTDDEVVHHINGDTLDNRPENLQLMSRGEHSTYHNNIIKLRKTEIKTQD
jgi:hypothetical protein